MDGTGRLGRLLITFLLCEAGALKEPELYLSLYFKAHRKRYYELLQSVRETGDWHSWILFSLKALSKPLRRQLTPPANFWTCSRRTGEPHRHSAGLQHRRYVSTNC
ncbi:hypothetical protein [Bradyrhizobium sp. 131]|uniref:hypothetical protein n=1 Tax=Bradyrhizobium sp. 131 TaxID=2782609 RepID=UPI001FFF3094|nr:hypothetical protein [Bradyrhizobium sp. 131]